MRDAEQLSHADSNFLDTPEPELVLVSPRSKRKKSRIVVKVKGRVCSVLVPWMSEVILLLFCSSSLLW